MLLDPLGNLGKVLVLLANVVLLAQVDEVYYRLCGQEEKRVDNLNLDRFCQQTCLSYHGQVSMDYAVTL